MHHEVISWNMSFFIQILLCEGLRLFTFFCKWWNIYQAERLQSLARLRWCCDRRTRTSARPFWSRPQRRWPGGRSFRGLRRHSQARSFRRPAVGFSSGVERSYCLMGVNIHWLWYCDFTWQFWIFNLIHLSTHSPYNEQLNTNAYTVRLKWGRLTRHTTMTCNFKCKSKV